MGGKLLLLLGFGQTHHWLICWMYMLAHVPRLVESILCVVKGEDELLDFARKVDCREELVVTQELTPRRSVCGV